MHFYAYTRSSSDQKGRATGCAVPPALWGLLCWRMEVRGGDVEKRGWDWGWGRWWGWGGSAVGMSPKLASQHLPHSASANTLWSQRDTCKCVGQYQGAKKLMFDSRMRYTENSHMSHSGFPEKHLWSSCLLLCLHVPFSCFLCFRRGDYLCPRWIFFWGVGVRRLGMAVKKRGLGALAFCFNDCRSLLPLLPVIAF